MAMEIYIILNLLVYMCDTYRSLAASEVLLHVKNQRRSRMKAGAFMVRMACAANETRTVVQGSVAILSADNESFCSLDAVGEVGV